MSEKYENLKMNLCAFVACLLLGSSAIAADLSVGLTAPDIQVALKSDASFKGLGRIWRMPTTFVIDKAGILRKNGHVGDAEITLVELESLVTPLLGK